MPELSKNLPIIASDDPQRGMEAAEHLSARASDAPSNPGNYEIYSRESCPNLGKICVILAT